MVPFPKVRSIIEDTIQGLSNFSKSWPASASRVFCLNPVAYLLRFPASGEVDKRTADRYPRIFACDSPPENRLERKASGSRVNPSRNRHAGHCRQVVPRQFRPQHRIALLLSFEFLGRVDNTAAFSDDISEIGVTYQSRFGSGNGRQKRRSSGDNSDDVATAAHRRGVRECK
jgi:hypothetical protein